MGATLEKASLQDAGHAERVVVDKDKTTIIGGGGAKAKVMARVEQLRRQIKDASADYERTKLQERLAKLVGGVAVIRAGAPSEAELKAIKEAFEDAISSTKAAIAEGIVPGAGLALLRCIDAVEREEQATAGDERTGLRILRAALEAPIRQIAANSAMDSGVVVDRMRRGTGAFGLNAATGAYVDLVDAGIIDPTKVVRVALENAVSVASLLLLTEATMTEIDDEPKHTSSAMTTMNEL